jgi:geranylgeranyl pyrophosphate synthase
MTNLFEKGACLHEQAGPSLARIFRPISQDLQAAQESLTAILTHTPDPSLREIMSFLLESPGKRIRPALVLLSAGAASGKSIRSPQARRSSVNVAAAVEVIHIASLVHDDLIDGAAVRHHRPSVHVKWGKRTAVAVGDYLCACALQLIADCEDPQLFAMLGPQLCEMCDGEIQQVVGRDDFRLSEPHCLAMIEKKTAALFVACCGTGAITAMSDPDTCTALQAFGRHFGIAFQMLDDCKDVTSDRKELGKVPGQDLLAGDVTLPLLHALSYCCQRGEESLSSDRDTLSGLDLADICEAFHSSRAPSSIGELIASHIRQAKHATESVGDSDFKSSLHWLADNVAVSASHILAR